MAACLPLAATKYHLLDHDIITVRIYKAISVRSTDSERESDLNERLHSRALDQRPPPVRNGVAPRPQHEPAPRLVSRGAPARRARRARRSDPHRLVAHGIAGSLVDRNDGLGHGGLLKSCEELIYFKLRLEFHFTIKTVQKCASGRGPGSSRNLEVVFF